MLTGSRTGEATDDRAQSDQIEGRGAGPGSLVKAQALMHTDWAACQGHDLGAAPFDMQL